MNKTILVFMAIIVLLLGLLVGYWAGYKKLWLGEQEGEVGNQILKAEDLEKILNNVTAPKESALNEAQRKALESLSNQEPAPEVDPKILELLNAPTQGN